jgi:predicted nucleic acid-binding protein
MPSIETKVVDASALVALVCGEPAAETVVNQMSACNLVAPALLDFEVANTCASKIRRQPARRADLLAAYKIREQIKIETMEVDHAAVLVLAQRTGLTGYDASYLLLSRTLGVELVTLDRQLAEAAEKLS